MKYLKHLVLLSIMLCFELRAQTLTDGFMMPSKSLCTGFTYSHDSWKSYWQGKDKRENGNIGTLTTQNVMWMGTYGITDKLNVIAMVPYVWTKASAGTLHPMQGIQDLTLGVKYRFFNKDFGMSSLRFFGILSGSIPLTNYTPDFLPLSIGVQSKTVAPRLSAYYILNHHWFANLSGAYNFRSNITLDRSSYYTNDQLYLTNKVAMYNQFLLNANIGYKLPFFWAEINYSQQNTLGGGDIDIRQQDMPFASNRMNFAKLGVTARYYLPYPHGLAIEAMGSYTVAGRNVGQSTMYSASLFYTIIFKKDKTNLLL